MSFVKGERVVIPEFEIVSNPTVRISDVKQQRFHVIDRVMMPAEKPRGWFMSEIQGIGIVNPRSIQPAKPISDKFSKEDLSPEDQFFGED